MENQSKPLFQIGIIFIINVSTNPTSCRYEVTKSLPQICKLAVNFNEFEWGQRINVDDNDKDPENANENNPCPDGSLIIKSSSEVLQAFCGQMNDAQIEISYPDEETSITFKFELSSTVYNDS